MRLEIEVPDPPAGWEYTGEFRQVHKGEHYVSWCGIAHEWEMTASSPAYVLILRRKEPVRESRWVNVYASTLAFFYDSKEMANRYGDSIYRHGVIRLDYENNKLVSVTLEPLGEGGGDVLQ